MQTDVAQRVLDSLARAEQLFVSTNENAERQVDVHRVEQ